MNRRGSVAIFVLVGLFGPLGCGSTDEGELNLTILTVDDDGEIIYPTPPAEILADTNRTGRIDFDDPDAARDKTQWSAERGAIFLANIDDDERRCRRRGTDDALAACNDAADEIVNGQDDLADLARVKTRPWPEAPDGAQGRLILNDEARERVRIFFNAARREAPESFVVFDPAEDRIEADDLRLGVEFAIEGKDVIRDHEQWDGTLDLTWAVHDPGFGTDGTDTVRLRQAPVVFRHHLDPAEIVFASRTDEDGNAPFLEDLDAAVAAAGLATPLTTFDIWDQWTQDLFESGYMAMPGPDGMQIIHVYVRSANIEYPESLEPLFETIAVMTRSSHEPPLREGGRVVYTNLRGPGVAGLTQYHPDKGQDPFDLTGYDLNDVVHWLYGSGQNQRSYPEIGRYLDFVWERDTLDSFGNTETIPPYRAAGQNFPLGRIVRGGTSELMPDPSMSRFFEAQQVQDPLYVDTSWLVVAHIDETVSFISSETERGWSLVVNDPAMARSMLQARRDEGHGDVPMFVGKYHPVDPEDCSYVSGRWRCPPPLSASVTIAEVLDDEDVMAATARAAIEVDAQLEVLRAATALTDEEIIPVPFLHESTWGQSVAYQPGTVNGIALTPELFGAPDPHGPVIDGQDIFKVQLEEAFGAVGVSVTFIENWDHYHVLLGEVHCGSNVQRRVDATNPWWEVYP